MMIKIFVRKVLPVLLGMFGVYFAGIYLYSEKAFVKMDPAKASSVVASEPRNLGAGESALAYQTGWQPIPKTRQMENIESTTMDSAELDRSEEIPASGDLPRKQEPPVPKIQVTKLDPADKSPKPVQEPKPNPPGQSPKTVQGPKPVQEPKPEPPGQSPKTVQEPKPNPPGQSPKHVQEPKPESKPKVQSTNADSPKTIVIGDNAKKNSTSPKVEKPQTEAKGTAVNTQNKDLQKPATQEHKWSETPYKETQTFKSLDGDAILLYSAFWDMDNNIRLFGLLHRVNYKPSITCKVWTSNPPAPKDKPITATSSYLVTIPEHHSKKYTAGYVICRMPPDTHKQSPILVTLSVERGPNTTHVALPIHQKQNWTSEFTVCIAPLFKAYDNVGTILEMVEFNRLLGATKLFFYNFSIGVNVMEALEHYKRKGLVEIMNWPLPQRALSTTGRQNIFDLHYFGQLTAMNDCVYRNRYQSRYVVLTDIDEFIVPNITSNMSTWSDLMAARKKINPKATVFWIKNVFFRKKWAIQTDEYLYNVIGAKFKSVVLSNLFREGHHFRYGERSKNIVDPLGVRIVGIHNIWERGGPRDPVPPSFATLHHYRSVYFPGDKQKRIHDDCVKKRYGTGIVKGVEESWKEITKSRKRSR